ncbi:MAG: NIPSNAP family protein [Bacteroidia bacterium]|nr:NIPSNAP family protein [Bacteroidia bacterium]
MKSKTLLSLIIILLVVAQLGCSGPEKQNREFYQLTVYHYNTGDQEKILDNYLQSALIPALHEMNIPSVGVFKAIANDTSSNKTMYVLVPIKSLNTVDEINAKLPENEKFTAAGKEYADVLFHSPAYSRMETILLKAFAFTPEMQLPKLESPKKERVYELRSYESASEKIFRNKVHMFNEGGEAALFDKLNFNAVFYGEVIAGAKMPNLMYMTTFENQEDRDVHWGKFSVDSDWKQMSSLPEYQNNVSHIDITFLRPADYSDY